MKGGRQSNLGRGTAMEQRTDVKYVGGDAESESSRAPIPPETQTRPAGVRPPVEAIEAFEEVCRSHPDEFRTISGVADMTPDVRRTLADLLMLSAPARSALVEVLRLPDDVRLVVLRVLKLSPEVRETLRVFLSA
jgi:hypothetical protein